MPEPQAGPPTRPKPPIAIVSILAACAVCGPLLTQPNEGLAPKPYWDPAHIRTYCYGETENVDERLYAKDECATLLRRRLAEDYAPRVLKCLPQLAADDRKHEFAALIDAAYNAGWAGVCKSPMALKIKANDWNGAANAFTAPYRIDGVIIHGWFASAKNRQTGVRKELKGLVRRRKEERCVFLTPEAVTPNCRFK